MTAPLASIGHVLVMLLQPGDAETNTVSTCIPSCAARTIVSPLEPRASVPLGGSSRLEDYQMTTPNTASEIPTPDGEWTCAMHPEVREPEAGVCPKCGMPLVPTKRVGIPDV